MAGFRACPWRGRRVSALTAASAAAVAVGLGALIWVMTTAEETWTALRLEADRQALTAELRLPPRPPEAGPAGAADRRPPRPATPGDEAKSFRDKSSGGPAGASPGIEPA